jgi:hypothetical protein
MYWLGLVMYIHSKMGLQTTSWEKVGFDLGRFARRERCGQDVISGNAVEDTTMGVQWMNGNDDDPTTYLCRSGTSSSSSQRADQPEVQFLVRR